MPAEVVMIPSNGSRTEVVVDQVREIRRRIRGELGISLSLEGFQKTNDRLRREGSWETVWKTFEQLRAIQGVSVKINTVLRRENADELLGFMREVRRRGPDFHSVILLRGDTADASQQLPDPQHLAELVPGILEEIDRYTYGRSRLMSGILRNYHRHAWDIALRTLAERRQVIPCLGGCAHSVVWADGTVSPCEMLPAVGSLHDAPLSVIRRSADWQHWRESIRRGECWCTHNCALLDSVFFNPVQLYRLLVQ
jgi:sulfatase maturation enzyme AslB (radical SAM superfamily)